MEGGEKNHTLTFHCWNVVMKIMYVVRERAREREGEDLYAYIPLMCKSRDVPPNDILYTKHSCSQIYMLVCFPKKNPTQKGI